MNDKYFFKTSSFRRRRVAQAVRMLAVLAGMVSPGLALAQLSFSQSPPLAIISPGVKPDIILAIDDSGSMWVNTDATENGQPVTRIKALKDALAKAFSDPKYLNQFRFAFEAMWNNRGFGPNRFFQYPPYDYYPDQDPPSGAPANSNSFNLGNYMSGASCSMNPGVIDNSMQWFDAAHQQAFLQWVCTLTGQGDRSDGYYSTPSQLLMIYAGEYLKGRWLGNANSFDYNTTRLSFTSVPSENNPWNETWASGATAANTTNQSCRRSYFIFMTDGLWNMDEDDDGDSISMPYISDVDPSAPANYDGTSYTVPDNTQTYKPATLPIYSDTFPAQTYSPSPYTQIATYSAYTWYGDPTVYIGPPYWSPNRKPTSKNPPPPVPYLCDLSISFGDNAPVVVSSTLNTKNCSSTLSDFSMYYWSHNLTGDTSFKVVPKIAVADDQTFTGTSGGKSFSSTYTYYWNPVNDPATWQHMQTYTIGYGTQAQGGAGQITGTQTGTPLYPAFDGYDAFNNVIDYGKFFSQFASGAVAWPAPEADSPSPVYANLYDLVHAAYNGRGKFYPATSQEALTNAFEDILQTAILQSSGGLASASASGNRLTNGTVAYIASYGYDTKQANKYDSTDNQWGAVAGDSITGTINGWSGAVTANAGNDLYAHPLWPGGATIPVAASRHVFTANASGVGIPFAWSSLNGDPLVTASGLTQTDVNAVLNNPLGDIVNSQLVYVGQPSNLSFDPNYAQFITTVNTFNNSNSNTYRNGVVYVGANDGMLHGFDGGQGSPTAAGSGQEVMAYVPRGLFAPLHTNTFASASYAHRYWVDGSPFSGDAQLGTNAYGAGTNAGNNPGHWATVLVGALGAGGPGYFVLDVTNPAPSNAGSLVLIDATDTSSTSPLAKQQITNGPAAGQPVLNYIGNQFGQPVMEMYTTRQSAQITQINTQDGTSEWAVIMGNGYNSASGVPVLLVQSLSHPGTLYTVSATCTATAASACIAAGNGLSAPRPIDVDGNGTADIVYAGDLMGNLWKFDISNPDHTQWKVANGTSGQPMPMFTAVGPTGAVQPITSAPVAAPNPNGGFMVGFGTGKNLTSADLSATNLNSFYALYDNESMSGGTAQLPGTNTSVSQITLGSSTTANTAANPSPIPATCRSGTGPARYSGCLYQQTGGVLSAADSNGLHVGISSSQSGQQNSGNKTPYGWYYDIPEIANGNAGKVLDNPVVMSGNTLMFYSQNAASSTGTNTAASSANTAESCDGSATINGTVTTVNFFNLFSGNPPDNALTITIAGTTYPPGDGNRFQIDGVSNFIPNGADSIQGVGKDVSIQNPLPTTPGKRVGWRIGR